MNILTNFKHIQAFILDVDGVLTDGNLLLLESGEMARTMNIKDGYAMQLAIKKGYKILVISGGKSEAVVKRLQKLGITDIYMGVVDKVKVLENFLQTHQLSKDNILYIGDDIPDLAAMKIVGVACCPADAAIEVRSISHYICTANGGRGCVREVIQKVMLLNNHWNEDATIAAI